MRGANLPADVDAAAVRQPGIEQRDIGCGCWDAMQGIGGGRGLTDDEEIIGRCEQVGQASPNQLVIIKDEDSDGFDARHG